MTVSSQIGAPWVLLGAGGHARSLADVITRGGSEVTVVVGAEAPRWGGARHVTTDEEALALAKERGLPVAVAIGDNLLRERLLTHARARGATTPPVIARTASVGQDAQVGDGTQVLEHAHLGPGSHVGQGVIVNTAAVIEHDCEVGDAVHVGPCATLLGAVHVGDRTFVGSGARVLPGVRVGADCVIGAGAVVIRDLPDGSRAAGVPARPLDRPASEEEQ